MWKTKRAADVMTAPVRSIQRDQSLEEAVRILTDEGISGAPVVDHHGQVVGVLSLHDVLAYLGGLERGLGKLGHFYYRSFLRVDRADGSFGGLDVEDDLLKDTSVDDVMTPDVITVAPDDSLPQVVSRMVTSSIHRVLVTDASGLCGLVSSMDMMRALTEEL